MKKIIPLFALTLMFFACKKHDKQYSFWKINGTEYSSNNVTTAVGKAIAIIGSSGKNRFEITFYNTGGLPYYGNYLLVNNNIQNPNYAHLFLYIDTIGYTASINEYKFLKAERVNGKIRYTLPQMWFTNYYNPLDSVLVEGIFNEP